MMPLCEPGSPGSRKSRQALPPPGWVRAEGFLLVTVALAWRHSAAQGQPWTTAAVGWQLTRPGGENTACPKEMQFLIRREEISNPPFVSPETEGGLGCWFFPSSDERLGVTQLLPLVGLCCWRHVDGKRRASLGASRASRGMRFFGNKVKA